MKPPQMPSFHPSLPSRIGPYPIVKEIARGAMGVVYLGRDPQKSSLIALKVILKGSAVRSSNSFERFQREIKVIRQLKHPHIVALLGYGKEVKQDYFVMEYVEGESLKDRLAKGSLPIKDCLAIVISLARAMDYAHQRQIIHRDLKPANILLTRDGMAKITDFGLAKDLKDDSRLTRTGAVVGSPTYMSPEQVEGKVAEKRSDIYSLGVILFELLVGRRPYDGTSPGLIYSQILRGDIPSLRALNPKIPLKVQKICHKAMARHKKQRHSSAKELADELEACLKLESTVAPKRRATTQRQSQSDSPPSSRKWIIPLCLVLGVLIGLFIWSQKSHQKTTKKKSITSPPVSPLPEVVPKVAKKIQKQINQGEFWEALQGIKAFLKKYPSHNQARLLRAKCWIYLSEWNRAKKDLKKIKPPLSQTLKAKVLWAFIWRKNKEISMVQKVLREGESVQNDVDLAYLRFLMASPKQLNQRMRLLANAISIRSRSDLLYARNSLIINGLHKPNLVYKDQHRELSLYPKNFPLFLIHGLACMKLGKFQEALNLFLKARKLLPKDRNFLPARLKNHIFTISYQLGKAYFFLRQYKASFFWFEKSKKDANNSSASYYWQMVILIKEKDFDRAYILGKEGLAINYTSGLVQQMVRLYLYKNQKKVALALLSKAIKKFPKDFEHRNLRALIYGKMGRKREAKADLSFVLKNCRNRRARAVAKNLWDRLSYR